MKKTKILSIRKSIVLLLLLFISMLLIRCNIFDDLVNSALDFDGIFTNSSGWEVTLESDGPDSGTAIYTKAGTSSLGSIRVGDALISYADRTGDNTWDGSVRDNNGSGNFTSGVISIDGDNLSITPENKTSNSFVRVSAGSGGGTSGGGVVTPGTSKVLVDQCVDGEEGDKKIITINVPASVKKMEIRTSEVVSVCDRNTADMFVRKGSNPTVTKTPTYSWVADCASIKVNRESETCIFTNPASGQWYIMLFGFNTYFYSHLTVTITY